MDASVRAEWDRLKTVVLHRPGMEMFFGLLEPYASLYERAFSRDGAVAEHRRLEEVLHHEFGVSVLSLRDTITTLADTVPAVRERLIGACRELVEFTGDDEERRFAILEFEKNVPAHDAGHYFDILMTNPKIDVRAGPGMRNIDLAITARQPLSNLYFMRDQQAVCGNGVIVSKMAKPQRAREPALTRLFWEATGSPVVTAIEGPGAFEGGDLMPLKEFALIGMGDRTNRAGVEQILSSLPGFDEIAVVHQPTHPLLPGALMDPMVAMHLDTYFNVASGGVAIGSAMLMKRAKVERYYRDGDTYQREPEETDLYSYICEKGFDVIDITTLEQMAYAPNFLCVRDGTILAVEVDRVAKNVLKTLATRAELDPDRYAALHRQAEMDYRMLKDEGQFFPHKKEVYQHNIDAYPLSFRNLTGGYGAAHCMTCVVNRG